MRPRHRIIDNALRVLASDRTPLVKNRSEKAKVLDPVMVDKYVFNDSRNKLEDEELEYIPSWRDLHETSSALHVEVTEGTAPTYVRYTCTVGATGTDSTDVYIVGPQREWIVVDRII